MMISIIVPVYNCENYLQACVSSILNQTYKNIEIILVNDASTDTSGKICDRIAEHDSRVKVLHHEKNRGLSDARYDGVSAAKGEWIGFVDNDDYLAPWVYAVLMHEIGDSQMSCLGGIDSTNDEFDAKCQGILQCPEYDVTEVTGYEADKIYMRNNSEYGLISCAWGKLYRRKLIDKVLNETTKHKANLEWLYLEDIMMIPLVFLMAEKVTFCKAIGYIHRTRRDSLGNSTDIRPYHVQTAECGNVMVQYFRKHGYKELYDSYLEQYLANLEGIWYRIFKYEVEEKKNMELKPIIAGYKKYYSDFAKLHKYDPYAITIFLFYRLHWLWKLTVARLYFARKYKKV